MFLPSVISSSRRRSSNLYSVSIGSGPFTTGTELTATVNGLEGGETVTYQWTDDGVKISGATASTYTAAIGTDSVADASQIRCVAIVDGGDPITSAAREIRYAAGSVTESALADWTIDDAALNIDFTSDFTTTNLTGSYVITGLPDGVVDDGDGTISGTVDGSTETPGTQSVTVTFTDHYGRTIVGSYAPDTVYRTAATGGADLDLSFEEDSAITATDLLQNWTLNGNTPASFTITPSLPEDLEANISGSEILLSGTALTPVADDTYTLEVTFDYGRTESDTFTLEITEVAAASNPDVVSAGYTAPSAGAAAAISIGGSYTGADTLTVYGVTGTEPITVTEAQLIAGSGGTNTSEFFSVSSFDFADGSFDLTGLSDETADAVVFVVVEDTNGGSSGLITSVTGITGLDFTAPTFSSAEVGDVDADTVRVTMDSALYGSTVAGDWSLTGNTISAVSFTDGNSYVDLTLGTTAGTGDDYTGDLSFSGSNLTDVAENALASFSGEDVTNNVPSATMPAFEASYTPTQASNVYTQSSLALGAGEFVVGIAYQSGGSGQTVTSMVIDGQTVSAEVAANDLNASGVALYRVTTTNASWDIVLTMSGALANGVQFYVWGAGSNTAVVATNSSSGIDDLDPPINQNINTETGGKVIGVVSVLSNATYDNLTGVALVEPATDVDNFDNVAAFEADVVTGETPRTVSIGGTGGIRHAIAVLSLGAAP